MRIGWLIAAALTVAASSALAQQPQTARIRGEVEKVDGPMLTVRSRAGSELKVQLAENARVMAMVKASLADVTPGKYIGVTAMPEPDGTETAIAIHIFTDAQRGVGEGVRPWDLRPNSTMTNAAVDTVVEGIDGTILVVRYKDGEKKFIIAPETPIVAYEPSDRSEIKSGAQIFIMTATKQPDGTFQTPSINVGRGVTPPM